jgi:hypothetical protein
MARTSTWEVLLDDGTEHAVQSDQRDLARWEAQSFAQANNPYTYVRFLAWSAMNRQGLYKHTFERFNERDCVQVSAPDGEDVEGEQGLDPGRSDSADAT